MSCSFKIAWRATRRAAMRYILPFATLAVIQSLMLEPSLAGDNTTIPIYIQEQEVGEITQLSILSTQDDIMKIGVEAVFADLTRSLDSILAAKNNLTGKCPYRIFWKGRSSIRGSKQNELHMTSRLGYELYVCVPPSKILGVAIPTERLTTKVLDDARMVEWTLSLSPARVDELGVRAHLTNIVGFPHWLEVLFGLHVTRHIQVNIPEMCNQCNCSELIDRTNLSLEEVTFSALDDNIVKASAVFSARNALEGILPCMSNLGW